MTKRNTTGRHTALAFAPSLPALGTLTMCLRCAHSSHLHGHYTRRLRCRQGRLPQWQTTGLTPPSLALLPAVCAHMCTASG